MFTLNCDGKLLVAEQPLVMGIINSTPDSFYEGSRFTETDDLLRQAEKMLTEGASILDIGGQSTRPGSEQVGITEELNRVIPAIRSIHDRFPEAIISIDTYYAQVAKDAVDAGASIINDISAGNFDTNMLSTAGAMNVPYVCMHMKGDPQSMQKNPTYENINQEILDFFIAKKRECQDAGIKDIIIDPGFGFGKTIRHNFTLLNHLEIFKIIDCPILVGISRKSTIYKTLGVTSEQALNGTTVLNTIALMKGASILRVHDVKEAMEVVKLVSCMK
ncbi:MAG: dihydropteroate synthase [Bacteroidetes bacterium]|nr:dihydropteroate synthase [Bacteroidota bacterium]